MTQKTAILIGGGLGDCIWQYFHQDYNTKLLSVKEKHDLHVTCYVHSINSQSVELLRYNPHIDEVISESYLEPQEREVPSLAQSFDLSQFDAKPMPIYLGEDEISAADSIKNQGEYVVIHPFAGEPDRSFIDLLPQLVTPIVKKGLNVVVVGGNSLRRGEELIEECDFFHDNMVSLVNVASVRLSCEVVRNAKFFIGSHSCYLMAAWSYGIKSLCLAPDTFMGYTHPDEFGYVKPWKPNVSNLFLPGNRLMFFSQIHKARKFLNEFMAVQ